MFEQEKAELSARFIETLLEVPVILCRRDQSELLARLMDLCPDFLGQNFPFFITQTMVDSFREGTLYHVTDFLGMNFTLFTYRGGEALMVAGPWLTWMPDRAACEEILQRNGRTLSFLTPLYQFFLELPILGNSTMLAAFRTAIRTVAGLADGTDIPYQHYQPQEAYREDIAVRLSEPSADAAMELLEHRYACENLMLMEVTEGNTEKALAYYQEFSRASRSIVRTEDPVRTSKNLGFSLNTMLRKRAELAGIHPVQLDIISANFAMLTENSNQLDELAELKVQMVAAYCRFVQRWRMDQYSPMIRKAVTYIRLHLGDPLSLRQVAAGIQVSTSYLSRVFNREVGQSIPCYISAARVEKAAELLSFTNMPIQNIAAYVGFGELNYFSRCFKEQKHMTPTEYRQMSPVDIRQPS